MEKEKDYMIPTNWDREQWSDVAQVAVAKVRTKAGLIEITAWEDERLEVLVAHDNRNETECRNLCKAIENECVFWAIAKDEYMNMHSGA